MTEQQPARLFEARHGFAYFQPPSLCIVQALMAATRVLIVAIVQHKLRRRVEGAIGVGRWPAGTASCIRGFNQQR